MRFDVLTLFPEMFPAFLESSIIGRAREQGLVQVHVWDIRDFTTDKHRTADDTPYGGGVGMVMKVEPVARTLEYVLAQDRSAKSRTVLLTPQGRMFSQSVAAELVQLDRICLICGHYEGVDERIRRLFVDDEISIGDYVLTGGELPAMVVIDAVTRLAPGVLKEQAVGEDSHASGFLEYPHYTRPRRFMGEHVPSVLLSGDHAAIARWRRKESLRRTLMRRPDLLAQAHLTELDRELLSEIENERRECDGSGCNQVD